MGHVLLFFFDLQKVGKRGNVEKKQREEVKEGR
jgi:hypothetical protein